MQRLPNRGTHPIDCIPVHLTFSAMSHSCAQPSASALVTEQSSLYSLASRSTPPRNTIVHVAAFGAPYPGSFIPSLRALAPFLKRAGLRQVLVLPDRAR